MRSEAAEPSERNNATLVAPAPAAEALREGRAPRADSWTWSGEVAVEEENTDWAAEKRSDASARIASLRVSNIDERSCEATMIPKISRIASAERVIATASFAERECRMRWTICEERRKIHGLDAVRTRISRESAKLCSRAGTVPNPADSDDELRFFRIAFNLGA